jgi:hypothetical protein
MHKISFQQLLRKTIGHYSTLTAELKDAIYLEFTHFLNSGDALPKKPKKMRHPFDSFR